MGFLVSINGVDFEPYQSPALGRPLNRPIQPAELSQSVREAKEKDPSDFAQEMKPPSKKAPLKVPFHKEQEKWSIPQRVFHLRDLMTTDVITISLEEPIEKAWLLFDQHGFRHLPVENSEEQLVGLISDRDLFRSPEAQIVKEAMSSQLFVATKDTLVHEAAAVMLHEKINALPVVNETKNLLGLVTTSDILKALLLRVPLELWA